MSIQRMAPSYNRESVRLTARRDLDTIGILSRDFDVLRSVSDSVFHVPNDSISTPFVKPTLLYPSYLLPAEDQAAEAMYEEVVSSLERLLQVQRHVVNFTEEWSRTQAFAEEGFESTLRRLVALSKASKGLGTNSTTIRFSTSI